jgi:carboxyl-terminal processing protease
MHKTLVVEGWAHMRILIGDRSKWVLPAFLLVTAGNCLFGSSPIQSPTQEATAAIHDFSSDSWSDAFAHLCQSMAREYAYTEWKHLDWESLHNQFEPDVEKAERNRDSRAFYIAIRKFLFAVPDSHVRVRGGDYQTLVAELSSATYGFNVDRLSSGSLIVTKVLAGGPSDESGLMTGARILRWNGKGPLTALREVPLWLNEKPPATNEAREAVRLRFLPRTTAGAILDLQFRNPGDESVRRVRLTAKSDEGRLLESTTIYASAEDQKRVISWKIIDGNVGYIKLTAEPSSQFEKLDEEVSTALSEFTQMKGVVLDLRHNIGGDDLAAMKIIGIFGKRPLYAYRSLAFDLSLGRFLPVSGEEFHIIPSNSRTLEVPVIVLVSPGTISAGESIAWAMQRFGLAKVLGFHSSAGAFGGTGGQAKMPTGFTAYYPTARTVDEQGRILVEGDAHGNGGIHPDIKLTKDLRSVVASSEGQDVELTSAVNILTTKKQ